MLFVYVQYMNYSTVMRGNNYNLKSPSDFNVTIAKTMFNGVEALLYLVKKLREIVLPEIKKS